MFRRRRVRNSLNIVFGVRVVGAVLLLRVLLSGNDVGLMLAIHGLRLSIVSLSVRRLELYHHACSSLIIALVSTCHWTRSRISSNSTYRDPDTNTVVWCFLFLSERHGNHGDNSSVCVGIDENNPGPGVSKDHNGDRLARDRGDLRQHGRLLGRALRLSRLTPSLTVVGLCVLVMKWCMCMAARQ